MFVNSVYGVRSTGKLIKSKCEELVSEGNECLAAYGREAIQDSIPKIRIGTSFDYKLHGVLSRIFDLHGLGSMIATRVFLNKIEKYNPDVIWLHNIHGYYLNYPMLFRWLKAHPDIKKYWTLHDCWAFTGHCAYFTMARCEKWKNGCNHCPQLKTYPAAYFCDHSKRNYALKKESFSGVRNLALITPSRWLADLSRSSFLKEYPVEVINNKIDHDIFRFQENDVKSRLNIENKFMILGVAVGWEETKGLPDMLRLREMLGEEYVIVLVGVPGNQINKMPDGIVAIERTADQQELAKLYSAADAFVNPTHQDNYPTVNLEARACGTPVITYDVGGSPESAGYEHVVPENDILAIVRELEFIRKR